MKKEIKLLTFFIKPNNIELYDGDKLYDFEKFDLFFTYLFSLKNKYNYYLFTLDYKNNNSILFLLRKFINKDIDLKTVKLESRDDVYYELRIDKRFIFRNIYFILNESFDKLIFLFNNNNNNNIIIDEGAKSLYSIILNANFWLKTHLNVDIYIKRTIPGLAFYIYKNYFYDINKLFYIINEGVDKYIRSSYIGGTADIYRFYGENIYHYDINSFFPFIMSNYDMPIGPPVWKKEISLETDFGFFRCKIKVNNINIPILEYRDINTDNLISPVGIWEGIYFSEEIKYAKSIGYEIEILDGICFKKDNIFKSYVHKLFDLKTENKNNSFQYHFFKMFLNSLYGWFGMKKNKYFINIENEEQHFYTLKNNEDIKYFEFINDEYMIVQSTRRNRKNYYKSYVQIASAITSYARIYLHKYKIKYEKNILYSDTDAIYIDCKMDDIDVNDHELGKFKLVNYCKEVIFIKPKMYYLKIDENQEIKKASGISSNTLKYEDYLNLLIEDEKVLELKDQQRIYKNNFHPQQIINNIDINITSENKRRNKIKLENNYKKYYTIPLHINT